MKIKSSGTNVFCGNSEIYDCDEKASSYTKSDIKLFKIELSKYYEIVDYLIRFLTPIEIEHADRYRHINDRKRFIICRSLLKYLLAEKTKLDISKIRFEKTGNHKPYFPDDTSLHFNLSHAGNYAIIAIGNCELGVDIEFIDNSFDFTEILFGVFSEVDIDLIRNSNNMRYSFYKFWTRKEAMVKALGKGIDDNFGQIPASDGLHRVESELLGNIPNLLVLSFKVDEQHIGSIAFEGNNKDVKKLHFYPVPPIKGVFYDSP